MLAGHIGLGFALAIVWWSKPAEAIAGAVPVRRNVSFTYTSDIREYEGSAYHITCEYAQASRDLVITLNQDGSEALKMLRYQWNQGGGPGGGVVTSVDESYQFKSNSSKRVTLSGVPPHTRVSIGLVPNPEHEQGSKYWIYIGSTCWTGTTVGKPSKVTIRPTSAFTHPLVEWTAPRNPNGPVDGYDFSWCILPPSEEKVKRSTRDAVQPLRTNGNSSFAPVVTEPVSPSGALTSSAGDQGLQPRSASQSNQGGQPVKGSQGVALKVNNGQNTKSPNNGLAGRAGQGQGRARVGAGAESNVQQTSSQKGSAGSATKVVEVTIQDAHPSTTTTTTIAPPITTIGYTGPITPKPEPKCATKDIPVNPANVDVSKGYKTLIDDYDPTATYRVCIRAYNWKGTDKAHSDEECQLRQARAYFEQEYFEMCPQ